MRVDFHKDFRKGLEKLIPNQLKRVDRVLELFEQDPHDPLLSNHALKGKLQGYRSVAAGGDSRLVFNEENDYQRVIFIRVGTHTQVYE